MKLRVLISFSPVLLAASLAALSVLACGAPSAFAQDNLVPQSTSATAVSPAPAESSAAADVESPTLPTLAESHTTKRGSSIILFDQSGSMGRYDPLVISKIWLQTMARTFAGTHDVVLVGFDADAHAPIPLAIGPDADMGVVQERLNQIKTRGKVTDLESPFRFLAGLKSLDDIDLILIISDGKPEIWDHKLAYLSPQVLVDPRYGDLKTRFEQMQAAGTSLSDTLNDLGPQFQRRNLDLIAAGLAQLPAEIGKKTVFWDMSADSAYLHDWAQALGAEYMPARIDEQENSVKHLLDALLKLQSKTSDLVKEPLPGDLQSRIDAVLSVVQAAEQQYLANGPPREPMLPGVSPASEQDPLAQSLLPANPATDGAAQNAPDRAQTIVYPADRQPLSEMISGAVLDKAHKNSREANLFASVVIILGLILISASLTWLMGRARILAVYAFRSATQEAQPPTAPPPVPIDKKTSPQVG
ncbi:vWA domain-containing protein [Magnetovibrio blakemorei]|uniref:VWFA domain-containing protein n=2 Tax=Pseudomonadota TaxID=1224 RepID=C4RAE8_9PROT|nr:VWA domain-containing protein [Magnetovibrio blakemorei]ASN76812.1 hypothetical protein [Vibrio sp. MV-1]OEJ69727.1 hypothetical protein BEN30_00040 [Magnetovibrio blakemorei]CAV30793.1 Hypothetical protein mv1g00046 [Magnetovibrio blakemorei]